MFLIRPLGHRSADCVIGGRLGTGNDEHCNKSLRFLLERCKIIILNAFVMENFVATINYIIMCACAHVVLGLSDFF